MLLGHIQNIYLIEKAYNLLKDKLYKVKVFTSYIMIAIRQIWYQVGHFSPNFHTSP